MKKLVCLFLVAILATSCQAQTKGQDSAELPPKKEGAKPEGSWTVNKELDENGNVVRYDSIYSWSSSGNHAMAMREIDADSLMNSMLQRFGSFGMSFPFTNRRNDSIQDPFASFFLNDFMEDDFFSGFTGMEEMRKRMEALQQQFMQGAIPGRRPLIPAVPEDKRKKKNDSLRLRSI